MFLEVQRPWMALPYGLQSHISSLPPHMFVVNLTCTVRVNSKPYESKHIYFKTNKSQTFDVTLSVVSLLSEAIYTVMYST